MTKKVLFFAFLILSFSTIAQKTQRIGYIDMEYILENIPEYKDAQSKINAKAIVWQSNIDNQQKEIETLKAELNNEKALLTKDLIEEKEEDIQIKELDLKKLQVTYFGADGDLYLLRQQLVKPVQDLVYNAIQDIATKRKYDFVLDNSSDLIMLYTNDQYDISELVINSISKTKKLNAVNTIREGNDTDEKEETLINNNSDEKVNDREAKKAEMQKKIADKKAAQIKKREELKKAVEEKRLQRIKDIEAAKKAKEENKKNN
jgi:Skp family chaperone for outer membrane proteins